MSIYKELPQHCMAFQLKNGETLLIGKEDIVHIAQMIIIEGSLNKTCTVLREADKNIEKANMLLDILKSEKDLDQSIRNDYLKKIGELLSSTDKSYEDSEGNAVIINSKK